MKSIIVMGMKHSGKSTTVRMLGEKHGQKTWDLDDMIRDIRGDGLSVREIFRQAGPEGFRLLEEQAAGRLAAILTAAPAFCALGGGTIDNPAAMQHLDGKGVFVYIHQEEAVLLQRILSGGVPPFLQDGDPREIFHALYLRRTALYERQADYIFEQGEASPLALVREIETRIHIF